MKDIMRDELGAPKIVDRRTFQAELDALRVREKAHTREGDVIAAARRRLASLVQELIEALDKGERGWRYTTCPPDAFGANREAA